MKAAYLWDRLAHEQAAEREDPERSITRALLSAAPQSNVLVGAGTIGTALSSDDLNAVFESMATTARWRDVGAEVLEILALEDRVYIVVAEGLTEASATSVALFLAANTTDGYLGAFEVDDRVRLEWIAFGRFPPRFRYCHREFRFLNQMYESGVGFDSHVPAGLDVIGPLVEQTGTRWTIADDFQTAAHAARQANLDHRLRKYGIEGDFVPRLSEISPRLPDSLTAALDAVEQWRQPEDQATVAVHVRRLVAHLADCLYPAPAGKEKTKANRHLWADRPLNRLEKWLESTTPEMASTLTSRFRQINRTGSSGVHASMTQAESARLAADLLGSLRLLLAAFPPPLEMINAMDGPAIDNLIHRVLAESE